MGMESIAISNIWGVVFNSWLSGYPPGAAAVVRGYLLPRLIA